MNTLLYCCKELCYCIQKRCALAVKTRRAVCTPVRVIRSRSANKAVDGGCDCRRRLAGSPCRPTSTTTVCFTAALSYILYLPLTHTTVVRRLVQVVSGVSLFDGGYSHIQYYCCTTPIFTQKYVFIHVRYYCCTHRRKDGTVVSSERPLRNGCYSRSVDGVCGDLGA